MSITFCPLKTVVPSRLLDFNLQRSHGVFAEVYELGRIEQVRFSTKYLFDY